MLVCVVEIRYFCSSPSFGRNAICFRERPNHMVEKKWRWFIPWCRGVMRGLNNLLSEDVVIISKSFGVWICCRSTSDQYKSRKYSTPNLLSRGYGHLNIDYLIKCGILWNACSALKTELLTLLMQVFIRLGVLIHQMIIICDHTFCLFILCFDKCGHNFAASFGGFCILVATKIAFHLIKLMK